MRKNDIVTPRLLLSLATIDDLALLQPIEKECDAYFSFDPPSPENHSCSIEECITAGDLPPGGKRERYYFYTVRHGEQVVGFFAYYDGYPEPEMAYLSVLYLSAAQRKSGFGSELVDAFCSKMKAEGKKSLRLHVSLRNVSGIRFWAAKGFDKICQVEGSAILRSDCFGDLELERIL